MENPVPNGIVPLQQGMQLTLEYHSLLFPAFSPLNIYIYTCENSGLFTKEHFPTEDFPLMHKMDVTIISPGHRAIAGIPFSRL